MRDKQPEQCPTNEQPSQPADMTMPADEFDDLMRKALGAGRMPEGQVPKRARTASKGGPQPKK